MTKKLEEEFNLPPLDAALSAAQPTQTENPIATIQTVEDAITISEKINMALSEVRGMEAHDSEMDDIARQAIDSYTQLMALGMNMTDMAAGPVFANAANMLKIALEAKDSKVSRKLKQVDLMLKKARLDKANGVMSEEAGSQFDRNELLKLINQKDK
jgi:fructose-1,6-bisphosphatase/inositol monophosphatase family enzyme